MQKFDNNKLPYYTVLFKQFPNALNIVSKETTTFYNLIKMFPKTFEQICRCSKSGHQKYRETDKQWINFLTVTSKDGEITYLESAIRHLLISNGEINYDENLEEYGGAIHLVQYVWNLLSHLEIEVRSGNKIPYTAVVTEVNTETTNDIEKSLYYLLLSQGNDHIYLAKTIFHALKYTEEKL